MRRQALITMIAAASSAATSDIVPNGNCDTLTVQVSGSFTSGKIEIQGKTDENASDWTSLAVQDRSDASTVEGSDGITAKGIYTANIAGLVLIRANVASVSGGTVTVVGAFDDRTAG